MLGKGRIDLVLYFCFPQCIKNLRSTQAQACTCTHISYYSSQIVSELCLHCILYNEHLFSSTSYNPAQTESINT